MKKMLHMKIISIITILTFLLPVFYITASSAYETHSEIERTNNNCATFYYTELISEFGRNTDGTCSYVAAAMLLSYYDSFWHEYFIDENYEANGNIIYYGVDKLVFASPGIKREPNWKTDDRYETYGDFISDKADEYFHLKLIQTARDYTDVYDTEDTNDPTDINGYLKVTNPDDSGSFEWAVSIPQVAEITQIYLSQQGINNSQASVRCLSSIDLMIANPSMSLETADATIRSMIIDKVTDGIPVVYAGFNVDSSNEPLNGHAVVAYDTKYNTSTDDYDLVFHTGWADDPDTEANERIMDERNELFVYTNYLYMMWIEIDETAFSHNCDENYYVTYVSDASETTECMCTFPMHEYHKHGGNYPEYSSASHIINCKWCDTAVSENHIYSYQTYNLLRHKKMCNCGYSLLEPHTITPGVQNGQRCVDCKAVVGSGGIQYNSFTEITYISENGSYIRNDGIVVLSQTDYMLYLLGDFSPNHYHQNNHITN